MTPLTEIVQGWTGALPFALQADGQPIDVLGLKTQAILHDCLGRLVYDSSSRMLITNSTAGLWSLLPSSSDFTVAGSPYRLHVRLTDSIGKMAFVPSDDASLIVVRGV